ncbi:MAG: prolyl oligopeptidase family serine peptidase [Pseudomonadales bacterium]|nr:prolyl oligopeptidase family serine peptidase [Pseudomonadales bacterium]
MSKLASLIFFIAVSVGPILSFAQDTAITSHQVYGYKDGMAMYYDVEAPLERNGRGIILIVSGGMVSGEDNLNIVKPFWEVLLQEGYTLFQIYHPAHPTYRIPVAYDSLKLGIEHIKRNSLKFGVDRNRLGMFGVSSGGYLALLLSMSVNPDERSFSDIDAVVAIMPLVDVESSEFDVTLFGANIKDFDPTLYYSLSPINHVSADDPPTLLIHGNRDEAVNFEENSIRMKQLLDAAGVENQLLEVDAGHETFLEPHMTEAHEAIIDRYADHLF